jgi:hypothetical protein
MQRPAKAKARLIFLIGLLVSIILYSAYNLYILDPFVYEKMSRPTRHFFKFGSLILAWAIGFLAFRNLAPSWLRHLWNILYASSGTLLLILAIIDAAIHGLPPAIRQPISTFHEALISPIPYVVIGLLIRATRPK